MTKPNEKQVQALREFAAAHGRNWKSVLRQSWMTGDYSNAPNDTAVYLQQVRNNFGPTWLVRFRLVLAAQ